MFFNRAAEVNTKQYDVWVNTVSLNAALGSKQLAGLMSHSAY